MGDIEGETVQDTVTSDATNASITVSDGRTSVDVFAEATSGGPTTVTVETSPDGTNWYERTGVFSADVSASTAEAETLQTGAVYIRARGDANVSRVEIQAKGV